MKHFELMDAQRVLLRLAGQKLPAKLAYAVNKNLRLIDPEMQDFEKARLALCEQYGKLNAEKNEYEFTDEERPKWEKEYRELADSEVEDYKPYLVSLELFGSIEMFPAEMAAIEFLIRE